MTPGSGYGCAAGSTVSSTALYCFTINTLLNPFTTISAVICFILLE